MKCSIGISNFLEEISSFSPSIIFLNFFALIAEEGFLISSCYSFEFCIQLLISFLFSFAFHFSSFIAKFRLKLKKVGKTARPFRYDLNQIPYDYTMEVRNRFRGLDLIECLMNYGMRFVTLYRRQGSRPSPWKRNAKKQNGCLGRPYK